MYNECEKVIDYFNDQLTEKEKEKFEQHLQKCQDCQLELQELEDLTEDLPFSSDPVEPPEGMKERVLGNVFAEDHVTENKEDKQGNIVPIETDKARHKDKENKEHAYDRTPPTKGTKPWLMTSLAAALAASLIGNIYLVTNEEQPDVTAPKESAVQVLERVQLQGQTDAKASAAMINHNDEKMLVVQADKLQPLVGNEVYQVWLINGETPYRAGTFVSNENGDGAVAFSMKELDEKDWDMIAVSKEPDASSETPQGEVLLSSEL